MVTFSFIRWVTKSCGLSAPLEPVGELSEWQFVSCYQPPTGALLTPVFECSTQSVTRKPERLGGVQGGQWETSTRIITGEEKRGFLREGGGTVFLCGNNRQCSESLLEVFLQAVKDVVCYHKPLNMVIFILFKNLPIFRLFKSVTPAHECVCWPNCLTSNCINPPNNEVW